MPVTDTVRLLVTVRFEEAILEHLRAVSERVELLYHPAQQLSDVPEDVWAGAEVLYTDGLLPEPAFAPHLRWVHIHTAGVDHVLGHPLFSDENIVFTNTSGIHTTNIAEYVFMMMLAFGHRLPTLFAYQREKRWPDEEHNAALLPLELRGSTLGIVGYGSIGREIAHVAQVFGMEVLAVKRDVRQPEASGSHYVIAGTGDPEGVYFHRLYPPEALISMVRVCDFVVLAVPLTDATRGMVSAEVLAAMKPTAYLVNISRGEVVDEAALVQALQKGQIAGAALDVFATEPLPAESPLWELPNVIISPHIAGNTTNYNEKAAQLFIENLRRYMAEEPLLNQVNRTRGY